MLLFYLSLIETDDDKDEFTQLYKQYRQIMYRVAYGVLKDSSLAEDAVQEAFIRILHNMHKIDHSDVEKTRGFVTLITKNIALSMWRKWNREVPGTDEELYSEVTKADIVEEHGRIGILVNIIGRLPQEQRDILLLVTLHGIKVGKAAPLLGISGVTARKRLQRARENVREQLLKEGLYEGQI